MAHHSGGIHLHTKFDPTGSIRFQGLLLKIKRQMKGRSSFFLSFVLRRRMCLSIRSSVIADYWFYQHRGSRRCFCRSSWVGGRRWEKPDGVSPRQASPWTQPATSLSSPANPSASEPGRSRLGRGSAESTLLGKRVLDLKPEAGC